MEGKVVAAPAEKYNTPLVAVSKGPVVIISESAEDAKDAENKACAIVRKDAKSIARAIVDDVKAIMEADNNSVEDY